MLELSDFTEYSYEGDSVKPQNQKLLLLSSLVTLYASVQICAQRIVYVYTMSNHALLYVHAIVVLV